MAVAATVPVRPSAPPPARRTVAWLLCTHLAWAAVDAVFCLVLASMWLLFWGMATTETGRLACGEGCALVTGAYKVVSVARVTLVLLLPFSMPLALMMARAQAVATVAATATDIDATKVQEPAPETSYGAMWDTLRDSLALGLLALMAFTLLVLIGVLVKRDSPVMGSRRERMGSLISDVGALGTVTVNCFVSCPVMTVRTWRAWRMARHSVMWYAVETKR